MFEMRQFNSNFDIHFFMNVFLNADNIKYIFF